MDKTEFKKLKVGDVVQITTHGRNRGKMGLVKEIRRNCEDDWETLPSIYQGGIAYLEPIDCEFVFTKNVTTRRNNRSRNGLYGWKHESIGYPVKSSDKIFYISRMYGEEGISWLTTNFNEKELKTIDRFLQELNEHIAGIEVDCVAILDNDEEE